MMNTFLPYSLKVTKNTLHFKEKVETSFRWSVPNSKEEIVMVASGLGNDWYNVFWGYDTLGARCELVTIFISPKLF